MHYLAFVAVPRGVDVESAIEEVLAPHKEKYDDDTDELSGFWDWWQLGGRWTGHLDGYDPEKDPANIETCFLCRGTGKRTDFPAEQMAWCGGCNGCRGKGERVKWPTEWKARAGDVAPAREVVGILKEDPNKAPFTFADATGAWLKKNWNGSDFVGDANYEKHFAAFLARAVENDHLIAVVDYHC